MLWKCIYLSKYIYRLRRLEAFPNAGQAKCAPSQKYYGVSKSNKESFFGGQEVIKSFLYYFLVVITYCFGVPFSSSFFAFHQNRKMYIAAWAEKV